MSQSLPFLMNISSTTIFSVTKKVKMKKLYCVICDKCRKFEKPEIPYILEKLLFFLLFAVNVKMKMKCI